MNASNWDQWPVCPKCGRRRQTVCPVCATAGIEFDLAEYLAPPEPGRETRSDGASTPPTESELEVLLMCPQCDEAFQPRFYRRCAECGFDFADGIEIVQRESAPLSPRVVWAIVGMVTLGVGLLVYFWWLLA